MRDEIRFDSNDILFDFRFLWNTHDYSSELDATGHRTFEHCCFIADPNAPDVKACPICQHAGRPDSDDILNAEFL